MTLITKPDFTYVWASGGAVVAPNDAKKQLGWVAEAPPFQYDNWLQNRQDQMLAHINQRGIAAWDALTNYEAGGLSYVQGSDGKVYKSVAASGPSATVQNPTTDGTDTYWTVAFADVGAFLTQAAGDSRYAQRSNNLSDLTNAATARTNLGVVAATETTAGLLEIATALEAQSFTANKAIDGAKLAEAFKGTNYSLAASGWQKLPSGWIIQWGYASSGNATITFPLAFPTAARVVTGNATLAGSPNSILIPQLITAANFYAKVNRANDAVSVSDSFNWLAIGH